MIKYVCLLVLFINCNNAASINNGEKITYINDEKCIKEHFQQGILVSKQQFKREKEALIADGFYEEFYPNRKIKISGQYLENKKEGMFSFYDEKGLLIEKMNYFDNEKLGNQFYFYPNGKIKNILYKVSTKFNFFVVDYDSLGNIINCLGKSSLLEVHENKELLEEDTLTILRYLVTLPKIKSVERLILINKSMGAYYQDTISTNYYERKPIFVYEPFTGIPFSAYFGTFKRGKNMAISVMELRDSMTNNLIHLDSTIMTFTVR